MSRKVLIIDDNEHERGIFSSFLRFVGGSVLEACDGSEGLRIASSTIPDLILLDLTMPVLDGWETIRRLKADPVTSRIPVIALTAHHLEWSRLAAAGFCAYLEKPIVPYRVLEEVESRIGSVFPQNIAAARRPDSAFPEEGGENPVPPVARSA